MAAKNSGAVLSCQGAVKMPVERRQDLGLDVARISRVSSPPEAAKNYPLIQAKLNAYRVVPGTYNSGPLCVDAKGRSHGLAAKLFDMQGALLPGREGVAFMRRDNASSRTAHAKYGFAEVAEFSYQGVEYLVAARTAAAK